MHKLQVSISPFLMQLSDSCSFSFHSRTLGLGNNELNILVITKGAGPLSGRSVAKAIGDHF